MKRLITLCMICFSLVVDASVPFNHIIVFGDSLSDNGNAYERTQHFVPQTPPYFKGRFTDGPVWVELISNQLSSKSGFLQDYALGGAGVTAEDNDADGLFTLGNQVKEYLLRNNQSANQDDLFILWIGANNYLVLPDDEDATVKTVKIGISKSLDKLLQAGAKNFFVLNLPELSKTPFAGSLPAEEVSKLASYTAKHNQMLKQLVSDYQQKYDNVNWYFYDTHKMFERVLVHPDLFGFINVTDTCYQQDPSAMVKTTPVIRIEKLFNIGAKPICNDFLFFDPVHPTGRAHQTMAAEMMSEMKQIFNPSSS